MNRVGIFTEYPTEERAREALRLMPRRPGRHVLRGDPPRIVRLRDQTGESLASRVEKLEAAYADLLRPKP